MRISYTKPCGRFCLFFIYPYTLEPRWRGGREGRGKGGRYAFVLMYVPVYHRLLFYYIFFFLFFLRRGWGWGSEEPLSHRNFVFGIFFGCYGNSIRVLGDGFTWVTVNCRESIFSFPFRLSLPHFLPTPLPYLLSPPSPFYPPVFFLLVWFDLSSPLLSFPVLLISLIPLLPSLLSILSFLLLSPDFLPSSPFPFFLLRCYQLLSLSLSSVLLPPSSLFSAPLIRSLLSRLLPFLPSLSLLPLPSPSLSHKSMSLTLTSIITNSQRNG